MLGKYEKLTNLTLQVGKLTHPHMKGTQTANSKGARTHGHDTNATINISQWHTMQMYLQGMWRHACTSSATKAISCIQHKTTAVKQGAGAPTQARTLSSHIDCTNTMQGL
jgi:hypothetical protein